MQKVERRLSKTLLKMSKKFLSLEEDIENISCEGIIYILFTVCNLTGNIMNFIRCNFLICRQNLGNEN